MKLPRNISGRELAKALRALDYHIVRQRGSHMMLASPRNGTHQIVIPDHRSLKVGTLGQLVSDIAKHHGMTKEELIERLGL